ncbi:hypothetical protein M8312_08050 [Sphingomonas sp. KRR8]|uniref:hypothetical protein n=1 Tax=Sphingomonas sp. KRR8 TaxID=2942996 RepID=UPI002020B5C2|nr:hypothetical protein [Sphingomonas sp. KRR8]URD59770.1 hypothetical protein M8312_08050 [Sphingomonas sp. KRR8]
MSGVRRLFLFLLLSGLASVVTAQSNVVAPPPPSRADTVGPEQLRDFALPGTREQPTQQDAPAATTPSGSAPVTTTTLPPASRAPAPAPTATAPRQSVPSAQTSSSPSRPANTVSVPLPQAEAPTSSTTSTQASSGSAPLVLPPATAAPEAPPTQYEPTPSVSAPAASEGSDSGWSKLLLPLLGLVIAGAALAWWWPRRRRAGVEDTGFGQLAFAGAPAGAITEPAPTARPAPAPTPTPTPAPAPQPEAPVRAPSVGLVSSRLRAWLDLELGIRVAAITEDELRLEVEILIANSGSAPAREIAVEALLINAGPEQGKELTAFFARPDADGFAKDTVAPMGQMALAATLTMPRGAFQEYAVADGKVVVPIIALNAGYKAGSSRGRTSAAFLAGRAGADPEKLAPFPTDQGAKGFSRLGLRRLPEQVRR